jgi:nucleotide-binding universal stress UspA family protein
MLSVKKILVPSDFSKSSDVALEKAADLAEKFDAKIVLLHAIPEESSIVHSYLGDKSSKELKKRLVNDTEELFKKQIEKVLSGRNVEVETVVKFGEPYYEILRLEKETDIDLIVIASHTKSFFEDVFFGSTTEKVVRRSKKSVFVVRQI